MHAPLVDAHGAHLLIEALVSIVALIVLIARYKINPFIVLFTVSLALAVVAGMPLDTVVKSFEAGVGGTLGHIALIVALGTILGKMMAESGGADRVAYTLIKLFGEKNVPWAMVVIGFIVGLPVFFEVGFVLLIPIAFNVARRTGKSLILVGLPMVAGLSVVHGLMPPHPAAMLAVTAYHADVGRTIFYALIVGIPCAILAGPLYGRFIAPHITLPAENPIAEQFLETGGERSMPGFTITLFTILLPVILMLMGSWANTFAAPGSTANSIIRLLGNADISLLAGVILSFVTFGTMRGFDRETILKFSNDCLAPTAVITLLVGAGGGFGRVLLDSGVASTVIHVMLGAHISALLLAWLLAAVVRLATGSATVAMTTAAAMMAPLTMHNPAVSPELLTLATGAGSLVFSHVNDGGFWLVKEYFNMDVAATMKSWSVCETIISVVGLALTLSIAAVR